MFESLQQGIAGALKSLRGQAKLSEKNMRDALKLVERAMLEADVSFPVVRDFMDRLNEQATGERVLASLRPEEHVLHIVYNELVGLMGPVDHSLHLKGKDDVTVLMMCGLQGSGKTTTCAKLGRLLKKAEWAPLLVAADLQRPAAIDQLHILGEQLEIPVYSDRTQKDPVVVCKAAVKQAQKLGANVVILDTAGRLHVDEQLMGQLERIDRQVAPQQCYLVVDGMTGQDAVNSAKAFNEALELDGVIMTKLDGDARGGAALSVRHVTGVPIKFVGTGEHLDELEEFHPDRMASRILGQGDLATIIDKAQREFDADEQRQLQESLESGTFTLDDFKKQMQSIKRLGPLQKVMGLIPGMGQMSEALGEMDPEQDMIRWFGVIDSMTRDERRNPTRIIDQSRRRRIATGAGVEPREVKELVESFDVMASMMRDMAGKGMRERMRMVKQMQQDAMTNPNGQLSAKKKGTGKRLSSKEKIKLQKLRGKELRRRRREGKSESTS